MLEQRDDDERRAKAACGCVTSQREVGPTDSCPVHDGVPDRCAPSDHGLGALGSGGLGAKSLTAKELRLVISPGDPEAEKGFLGMQGETEIWVEAESKTPLEIVGKIPKIPGKVRLILTEMG